jgi:hypothetical protein
MIAIARIAFAGIGLVGAGAAAALPSFAPLPSQPPDNVTAIAVNPVNGDLYAANFSSVIRSTDGGATWTRTASPHALGINTLYVTPGGKVYAGVDQDQSSPAVGLISYDAAANAWSPVAGAPLAITALVDDGSGRLIAGTGTTGNFQPNPINYGSGLYSYGGGSWSTLNSGVANLGGFSVPPFIKALTRLPNGTVVAATYGNGVLQLSGSTWSTFGSAIPNGNVSSLAVDPVSGTVYAGHDGGVEKSNGGSWANVSSGLPAKPVRSLVMDAQGRLIAGLGYYLWMDGNFAGEIFASVNQGGSWQSSGGGFASTDVMRMAIAPNGDLLAGAAGLWRSTDHSASWSIVGSANTGSAPVFDAVKLANGHLIAIASNQPRYLGAGGLFRSTDDGASWTPIVNGITRHRANILFADSHGAVWVGYTTFANTASNGSHTHGALFKSTDEGQTWVQNGSILVPGLRFSGMAESPSGKLYVSNGWGSPSNVSSSVDYATFDNSLNGSSGNGGMAFNVAVNANNEVFLGTETGGVMRSGANGTQAFTTVAATGNNTAVFIDRASNTLFTTSSFDPNGHQVSASAPADDGANLFTFQNLPTYAQLSAAAFDNRGNAYLSTQSGLFANAGLFVGQGPFSANSAFTKVMSPVPNISYYFSSMFIDACGYLYGMQSGIVKSTTALNTPGAASLTAPANGSSVTTTPTLQWLQSCPNLSYRLQMASDAGFAQLLGDVPGLTSPSYTPASALPGGATVYWRVQVTNDAGTGPWSTTGSFVTVGTDAVFGDGFEG